MKCLAVLLVLFLMSGNQALAFYQATFIFDEKEFIDKDSEDQATRKTDSSQKKKAPSQYPSPRWIIGFTNPMS